MSIAFPKSNTTSSFPTLVVIMFQRYKYELHTPNKSHSLLSKPISYETDVSVICQTPPFCTKCINHSAVNVSIIVHNHPSCTKYQYHRYEQFSSVVFENISFSKTANFNAFKPFSWSKTRTVFNISSLDSFSLSFTVPT